jgi:xanthine dehydrogenase molybdopterin-binding subunit B
VSGAAGGAGSAGPAVPAPARPFRVIGTRVAKLDAVDKVTGAVQYLPDLEVPGMVWGRILRTRVPHARIARIDTRRAEALPGVLGVVTGRNVAQRPFGYAKDHLPLEGEVVRCIRDEVAAVAAETEAIAAEACRLVEVDYDPLPAVFDPRPRSGPTRRGSTRGVPGTASTSATGSPRGTSTAPSGRPTWWSRGRTA